MFVTCPVFAVLPRAPPLPHPPSLRIRLALYCYTHAAGCGFLDTATQLVKLGADVNARDLTQCTPLQNAAHGTYSALATMPLNGTQNALTGQACVCFERCTTTIQGACLAAS